MRFRRTLDTIKRRKWSVIACGLVVGIAAAGFSLLRTPTATAVARVRLVPTGVESLGVNSPAIGTPEATVNALNDARSSAAVARGVGARIPSVTASTLGRSVSVQRVGTGDIVDVTVTNSNAVRAREIANTFARAAIESRHADVIASLRSTAKGLQPQLTALDARMTDLDAQARSRSGSSLASAQLAAVASQHQTLLSRQQDLRQAADQIDPEAVLVAPANAGSTTTDQHPLRDGLLGGLLGLLIGVIVALMREAFDERVRTTEAIETATGLPTLAELPRDPRSKQQPTRVAVFASPKSALSEATRALRAGIELRDAGHHPMSVLITSAASGEGKSLVSANLAAALRDRGVSNCAGRRRPADAAPIVDVRDLSRTADRIGRSGARSFESLARGDVVGCRSIDVATRGLAADTDRELARIAGGSGTRESGGVARLSRDGESPGRSRRDDGHRHHRCATVAPGE